MKYKNQFTRALDNYLRDDINYELFVKLHKELIAMAADSELLSFFLRYKLGDPSSILPIWFKYNNS